MEAAKNQNHNQKLQSKEKFLLFLFILVAIILNNFLDGLAISDVKQLQEEANYLELKHFVKRLDMLNTYSKKLKSPCIKGLLDNFIKTRIITELNIKEKEKMKYTYVDSVKKYSGENSHCENEECTDHNEESNINDNTENLNQQQGNPSSCFSRFKQLIMDIVVTERFHEKIYEQLKNTYQERKHEKEKKETQQNVKTLVNNILNEKQNPHKKNK